MKLVSVLDNITSSNDSHFWEHLFKQQQQILGEKMKCNVGMMIARYVAEKRYENKVGMSSY